MPTMKNEVVKVHYVNPQNGHKWKRPFWNVIVNGKYCHLWFGTKRQALKWLKEQETRTNS